MNRAPDIETAVRMFVGDQPIAAPAADDRGLAYGDGLFETMRIHASDLPWWDAHWLRLQRGARVLGLALPSQAIVREQALAVAADADAGVLKLLVTRGSGGRGYAPPADSLPMWMLERHPLPASTTQGLQLRWCTTRLALQPALAGIKHCNRLEQVLARAEWNAPGAVDPTADEGLMCSSEGDVVGAIAANLFVLRNGGWLTPAMDRCGVAGVCRAHLLPLLQARERRLSIDEVNSADAVFLCNAVRGILAVAGLGSHAWQPHPEVAAARRLLAQTHPGFTNDAEIS